MSNMIERIEDFYLRKAYDASNKVERKIDVITNDHVINTINNVTNFVANELYIVVEFDGNQRAFLPRENVLMVKETKNKVDSNICAMCGRCEISDIGKGKCMMHKVDIDPGENGCEDFIANERPNVVISNNVSVGRDPVLGII